MKRSKRFEVLSARPVNQDGLAMEWPEVGLVGLCGPDDPVPGIKVENRIIVEMDGKSRKDFDMIDQFIADHAIDVSVAESQCRFPPGICPDDGGHQSSLEKKFKITRGTTPAKMVEVISQMNVVEMMMAMQKLRARKTPSNQCHVTNVKDNPVLLAADAAEGAVRGFDEEETTVAVVRCSFQCFSHLNGSQTGRGGILTQCAVEEATELQLGMRGLTSYAESLSVYGTDQVFVDGDDTLGLRRFGICLCL